MGDPRVNQTEPQEKPTPTSEDLGRASQKTTEAAKPRYIDSRMPRFNQGVLALALLVAFTAQLFWIVPIFCAILLAGVLGGPKANPVMALYVALIQPRLARPKKLEDPRPPRFAAAIGSVFLLASTAAYFLGAKAIAWALALVVAALAALASVSGLCVGCEIYVAIMRWRGRLQGPWKVAARSQTAGADAA